MVHNHVYQTMCIIHNAILWKSSEVVCLIPFFINFVKLSSLFEYHFCALILWFWLQRKHPFFSQIEASEEKIFWFQLLFNFTPGALTISQICLYRGFISFNVSWWNNTILLIGRQAKSLNPCVDVISCEFQSNGFEAFDGRRELWLDLCIISIRKFRT